MNKSKRFAVILLAALIMLSMLLTTLSCADEKKDLPANEDKTDGATASPEATTEFSIYDTLPEVNYNGETFTIYNPPNPDSPVDKGITAEALAGEPFNDAIYNRNLEIESKYNIKLKTFSGKNWDSTYGDLKKIIAAGTNDYDVVFTHVVSNVASFATEGLVQDWTVVPHVSFDKPWWNASCINSMKIAGKSFYASGSMHIHDPLVLIANKNMITDNKLENPYELVKSGKWTLDKLIEMSKAVKNDVNGDGRMDEEDQYGLEYGSVWQIPSLFYGAGMQTLTFDENGKPTLNMRSEHLISTYQKIYDFFYNNDCVSLFSGTETATANHPHIGLDSNRVLFTQYNLFTCEELRSSYVDYAILPMPKYDEKQEGYRSVSWTGMLCIPYYVDSARLERIGVIMEAIAYTGYSKVIPVYYDIVLKEKYARDEDSRTMMDIIMQSIVYDMGLCFNDIGGPGMLIGSFMKEKKADYVSQIEKQEPKMQTGFDKAYDKIVELSSQ